MDTQEFLQTAKKEGIISLERDFKEYQPIKGTLPSGVKVNLNNLNDGSTLEANQENYHKKVQKWLQQFTHQIFTREDGKRNPLSA